MTISELASKAGVTPRTIRYYVTEGVLPPPLRGRPAQYTGDHLRRLELIRRLKKQYLPLEEIRDTMRRLTLAQVEDLLAQTELPSDEGPLEDRAYSEQAPVRPGSPPLTSAVDYVKNVLNRTGTMQRLKSAAPPPYVAPPAAAPAPSIPAPAPVVERRYTAPPAYEPAVPAAPEPPAETWQRIRIDQGIELHVAAPLSARRAAIVKRLIEAARRVLAETPEKDENRQV